LKKQFKNSYKTQK